MNPKLKMKAVIESKCSQKEDFIRSEQCRYTGGK